MSASLSRSDVAVYSTSPPDLYSITDTRTVSFGACLHRCGAEALPSISWSATPSPALRLSMARSEAGVNAWNSMSAARAPAAANPAMMMRLAAIRRTPTRSAKYRPAQALQKSQCFSRITEFACPVSDQRVPKTALRDAAYRRRLRASNAVNPPPRSNIVAGSGTGIGGFSNPGGTGSVGS
jgi:hypothetical protein